MNKVKELAFLCEVSEQAIRAWCRRNHVAKQGKAGFVIDSEVEQAILSYYHVDLGNKVAQDSKPAETGEKAVPWAVYEDLRAQLAIKDKQISDLSEALLQAQKAAQAAQALHAGTLQQITDGTKKVHWWQRKKRGNNNEL